MDNYNKMLEYCVENGVFLDEGKLQNLKNKFKSDFNKHYYGDKGKKRRESHSHHNNYQAPKKVELSQGDIEKRKAIYSEVMKLGSQVYNKYLKSIDGFYLKDSSDDYFEDEKEDFINGNSNEVDVIDGYLDDYYNEYAPKYPNKSEREILQGWYDSLDKAQNEFGKLVSKYGKSEWTGDNDSGSIAFVLKK